MHEARKAFADKYQQTQRQALEKLVSIAAEKYGVLQIELVCENLPHKTTEDGIVIRQCFYVRTKAQRQLQEGVMSPVTSKSSPIPETNLTRNFE